MSNICENKHLQKQCIDKKCVYIVQYVEYSLHSPTIYAYEYVYHWE